MKCNYQMRVQHVNYADMDEIVLDVRDIIDSIDNGGAVNIICSQEDAQELIKEFTDFDYIYVEYDYIDYTGDYLISVSTDYDFYCEKLYRDDGVIPYIEECEVTFVPSDCEVEVIEKIQGNMVLYSY